MTAIYFFVFDISYILSTMYQLQIDMYNHFNKYFSLKKSYKFNNTQNLAILLRSPRIMAIAMMKLGPLWELMSLLSREQH